MPSRLYGRCDGVEVMDNELYCPMKMTSNPLGRCVCEKREVRLVATVGQLLFHLADCMEVGRHRNKDEEVNEDETC